LIIFNGVFINFLCDQDLVKNLKSELGGKLEDVMVACMTPLDEFFAKELHDAISGLGTEEDVLIEILSSLNNDWIHAIKASYEKRKMQKNYYENKIVVNRHFCSFLEFGKALESDIRGDCSGCFERLLISLCQGMRDESLDVDSERVEADVQALYEAGTN